MNPKEYDAYVKQMGPKSPIWKDCFHAFWIGGLICVLGQLIQNGFAAAGLDKTDAGYRNLYESGGSVRSPHWLQPL